MTPRELAEKMHDLCRRNPDVADREIFVETPDGVAWDLDLSTFGDITIMRYGEDKGKPHLMIELVGKEYNG